MKTVRKGISIILVICMLISTFAFICASADTGRVTVNVRADAPKAGLKANYSIEVDTEHYVPGLSGMPFITGMTDAGFYCEEFGKVPTMEEFIDYMSDKRVEGVPEAAKYYKAYYSALKHAMTGGIAWIEYDEKDIEKLFELAPEYKDIDRAGLIDMLLSCSDECGVEEYAEIDFASSARYMQPGDKFKEGKSYACRVYASYNIEKEADALKDAINALMPYCRKKSEIDNKLKTASEDEITALNGELEQLKTQYDKELRDYEAVRDTFEELRQKTQLSDTIPVITVNGEKTEEQTSGGGYGYFYDFGKAEKSTVIDLIIEFFENIVNFFKTLFNF